ncbi:MAG TPA: hypothetical protein DEO95_06740 [Ruminococcaceae bacterium]|nr:hypothetical protein [Oscillospiraceae bacterium]
MCFVICQILHKKFFSFIENLMFTDSNFIFIFYWKFFATNSMEKISIKMESVSAKCHLFNHMEKQRYTEDKTVMFRMAYSSVKIHLNGTLYIAHCTLKISVL